MKKNLLFMLPILLTAILVNAQEITSYRGAFAPAPTRMWTESWTNFDPQLTPYSTPNVTVTGLISSNTTWTSNNVYLLSGVVYVDSNTTLTIQPGTVIRGASGNSSLLVSRGGKLIAEGTVCNPIVFTSNQAAGSRAAGGWGGVLMLGRARHNLGTQNLIEGLSNADLNNFHGGTDDNDNSGILKYVRIEYGGFIFSTNNEINGLTLGSVGRGTVIDYVQITRNNDDAFEWFGGSVNCQHLVAYQNIDDDFDTDNGFSGTVQYALSIKDPNFSDASQSEGFESDNSVTGNHLLGGAPKTSAKFYNITQIGGFRCASNTTASGVAPTALFLHRRGARIRRNSDLKIVNSILMNNWRGLFIDDALGAGGNLNPNTSPNFNEDSAVFRNNIIAGDFTTTWTGLTYNGTQSLYAENAVTRNILTNPLYANDSLNTCSLLTDAWNVNPTNADLRPNTAGAGAIVTNPANLNSGADLNVFTATDAGLFSPLAAFDFVATVSENGAGTTNGVVTLTIAKAPGWQVTVPGLTLVLNAAAVSGISGNSIVDDGSGNPTPNTNGDWLFRETAANIIVTSKVGTIIPKSASAILGFRFARRAATTTGTTQSLGFSVAGGGDNTPANNAAVITLGTQN